MAPLVSVHQQGAWHLELKLQSFHWFSEQTCAQLFADGTLIDGRLLMRRQRLYTDTPTMAL